jgi:hypothetical protein
LDPAPRLPSGSRGVFVFSPPFPAIPTVAGCKTALFAGKKCHQKVLKTLEMFAYLKQKFLTLTGEKTGQKILHSSLFSLRSMPARLHATPAPMPCRRRERL